MMYIGTVSKVSGYEVVVDIPAYGISPTCAVVQPSAKEKQVYNFPAVGDQVVAMVTDEVKVVFGAIYSDKEPLPDGATEDNVVLSLGSGKLTVKNDAMDLQRLLLSVATLLKSLKVATAMGPSGTILPDVLVQVEQYEQEVKQLIDGAG